jgi:hypothetical protein
MILSIDARTAALQVGLEAHEFYKPSHGHIYAAIVTQHRAGLSVDPVTIAEQLSRSSLLETIGGASVLISLQVGTPATSNAGRYARIIREHALLRKLIAVAGEIAELGYSRPDDLGAAVARAQNLVNSAVDSARFTGRPTLTMTWGEPDTPPEPAPVLVDGLIRAGDPIALAAPRGVGKSFFVYNLARLLADGHGQFLGRLEVQRPARVLVCQGELAEWQAYRRWKALGGKPVNVAESFEQWRIRVQRHRRPTAAGGWDEWTDAHIDVGLEEAIVDQGVEVLVIDPWRTYFSGGENSNDEAEQALSQLSGLSARTGVAIVVIHHISGNKLSAERGPLEPEDLWRGATRLADWASTRVTILPHFSARAADEAGLSRAVARRHVDVHFLRRDEPTEDFCAVLDGETGWWSRWENGIVGAGRMGGKTSKRAVQVGTGSPAGYYVTVVDAIKASGGSWPSLSAAAAAMQESSSSARRLLDAAVRLGLVEKFKGAGNATGYRLPNTGPPSLHLVPPPNDDDDPNRGEPT